MKDAPVITEPVLSSSKEMATFTALPEAMEPDDYMRFKKLEKQLEHLGVMEEYVKLETRNLEKELLHAQEEVNFNCFLRFSICLLLFEYRLLLVIL